MNVFMWAGVFALLVGCSTEPPPASKVSLDGDLVARVGDQGVAGDMVARASLSQGLAPRDALEALVSDALFAAEARSRGIDRTRRRELRQQLAKALFDQLGREVRAEGPPTKEELEVHAQDQWFEVRRPESRAVVHAVVQIAEDADSATVEQAKAFAEKIHGALQSIGERAPRIDGPDLMPRPGLDMFPEDPVTKNVFATVDGLDAGGLTVTREQLPPIGVDGLSIQPLGRRPFDRDFVAALNKLGARGAISPVVRSPYGWHVILLLAKYPGNMLSDEELAARFRDVIYAKRAKRKAETLMGSLRPAASIEIDPAADNLMGLLEIKP